MISPASVDAPDVVAEASAQELSSLGLDSTPEP